jgi:HEAT repeat protein
MSIAASLLLSALPQVFPGGDLQLPPRPPGQEKAPVVRPVDEIVRFRRDLVEMAGPAPKVTAKLDEMARAYPEMESLILEVARTARPPEMANLMPVARRFGPNSGTTRVGDELLFQLLSRPLGDATHVVVETMATLKGKAAKEALRQCVRGGNPAVRRHAVQVMQPLVNEEDLPFALSLSQEQSLDLQLRGVDLLQAIGQKGIGGAAACQRLVALLSKDPALAQAACQALVVLGPAAVATLQAFTAEPPIDRSFGYAAFALAQIARTGDPAQLPASLLEPLALQLASSEPLTQVLAAVPLVDLLHRSAPEAAVPVADAKVVEALLQVAEPRAFVPNLDLLRAPVEDRLRRLTGRRMVVGEALTWREWWQSKRSTFVGVRARVAVDATNAAHALVNLDLDQRRIRVLGEGLADQPPVDGVVEIVLTAAEMLALTRELESQGFGDPRAFVVQTALPLVRTLELQTPAGRAQVAVPKELHPAFDALANAVLRRLEAEAWQLYRIAADQPDRGAFWRSERRWLDANPAPVERGRRLVRRVLQGWGGWSNELRARAIAFVAGHPSRAELMREEDAELAVAALQKRPKLVDFDVRLLELVAAVPGDRVWRECIDVAVRSEGGGREAVRAVFSVLGPDALLAALGDDNALVRRAAIDEVVALRDVRASARLVELLADEDFDVRRGAVYACGELQVAAASRPLVALIAAEDTLPQVRRDGLRALGRVGGDLAFPVLQRALTSPAPEDKEAALRGLGDLADPRAAHLLAELLVVGHGKDIGALAALHLKRQGAARVVPALRGQLPIVQDERVRNDLVLMLGQYQDPANVPALMDLLRQPPSAASAAALLEGTTGVDLMNTSDRIGTIELWWRRNKQSQQWQWLLDGLAAAKVGTKLQAEQFLPGAGTAPVAELARLLVELQEPRLFVLTSAVLRSVTGEDYGQVAFATPVEAREVIAQRYRRLVETARAAQGR